MPRKNTLLDFQSNLLGKYQPKYDMVDRKLQSFKFVPKLQQTMKQPE
jgi:hypothetical protein